MSVLNIDDQNAIDDMISEIKSITDDMELIGIATNGATGQLEEYLTKTEAGQRIHRILSNFQNMLEEGVNDLVEALSAASEATQDDQRELASA